MSDRFFIGPVADGIPFDNDTNGFTSDTVQAAIEEARVSAIGGLLRFPFTSNGNTADKWLGYVNSAATSNEVPFIVPQPCDLKGLTFTNRDNNVDTNAKIYRNGTLVYTWQIRNKRVAWNVGIAGGPSFSQGDRVSIYLEKFTGGSGDNTSQDPLIEVLIKVNTEQADNSGIQNGL